MELPFFRYVVVARGRHPFVENVVAGRLVDQGFVAGLSAGKGWFPTKGSGDRAEGGFCWGETYASAGIWTSVGGVFFPP